MNLVKRKKKKKFEIDKVIKRIQGQLRANGGVRLDKPVIGPVDPWTTPTSALGAGHPSINM